MQHEARQLRNRIAILLASTGAIALPACGSSVETSSGTSSTTGAGGDTGSGGSGTTTSSTGSTTTTMPEMCQLGGAPTEQCQQPGPAGCPPASAIEDGCCNKADFGPFEKNGQCCYGFCEGACCGRPFTIAGEARVAGVVERDDWCAEEPSLGSAALDARTRAALVEAWLADAQMEHASVASFARFTLELLAAGAPADLVAASQRAALDEIEHAKLCFGIASRLGEQPRGPAPLDLDGALRGASLSALAASTVREGCIGETLASLTARAQLAHAEDAGVRYVLARIAEDEEAHAALAWRFVVWAIELGGAPVRAAVSGAFAEGMRRVRAARAARLDDGVSVDAWHRYGRLTAEEIDRVTVSTIDEVIAPCAAMLRAAASAEQPRCATA